MKPTGTGGSTDPVASIENFEPILEAHARWLETKGRDGMRASLTDTCLRNLELGGRSLRDADLTGADLTDANLRGTDLRDARLDGAILEGADIEDALLDRARLDGARLQGVRGFAKAQLRDACLEGVRGLTVTDLAGADLTGVRLPSALAELNHLGHLTAAIGIARPLYLFVLVVTGFILLTVFSTPDVALITNAPSAVMPNLSTNIPAASLFWIAPLILIFLYAYQHFYMARVWDDLAGLPAVLPDGCPIERANPWLFTDLVRMRGGLRDLGFRGVVLISLMWGAVPATLLAIWWRYLPLRDWPITIAHIGLALLAVGGALRLFDYAITRLLRREWRVRGERRILIALGISMFAISIFYNSLPWILDRFVHDTSGESYAQPEVPGIKPKNVLWLVADLEDGDLSSTVLTRRDLRYAYGHRANLVAVNLKDSSLAGSDFQRGDFSSAILEDVDLSHANLDSGRFRNACLRRADLSYSDLEDSDFTGAYLGLADLSYAYFGRTRMQHANLQGARLKGADFKGADLRGAVFNCYVRHQHDPQREPEVRCADFTDTNLMDADLAGVQFLGTDLTQARNLKPQQLETACGVNARLSPDLEEFLPNCDLHANSGIAPGALAGDLPFDIEDHPCWHEMLSDFAPAPIDD